MNETETMRCANNSKGVVAVPFRKIPRLPPLHLHLETHRHPLTITRMVTITIATILETPPLLALKHRHRHEVSLGIVFVKKKGRSRHAQIRAKSIFRKNNVKFYRDDISLTFVGFPSFLIE